MRTGPSPTAFGGRRLDARFAVRAATALLAVVLAVQVARLVFVFVRPDRSTAEAGFAVTLPIATAAVAGFDPFFRGGLVSTAPETAETAARDLVLYGVRAGGGRGSAILAGPDGVQRSYAVGEQVAPGVKLRSVGLDHVVLDRGGAAQRLNFPAPTSPPARSPIAAGPVIAAAQTTGAAGRGDLAAAFQSEASLRPNVVDRRIRGYLVTLTPGGVLARAGLRTGDVIMSVNGTSLDPDSLQGLPAELASRPEIAIGYERDGKPASLVVSSPS